MKAGVIITPRPTSGTFDGAPNTQTPSRAEHGPGGVFILREGCPFYEPSLAQAFYLWRALPAAGLPPHGRSAAFESNINEPHLGITRWVSCCLF